MISLTSYAPGVTMILLAFVMGLIAVMYMAATVLTHTKVIRLSLSEAILIAQFEGTFLLFVGLMIGQQFILALVVAFVFIVFSVLLFVKKFNRWWIERSMKRADSSTLEKEYVGRRG